jgi:hypothetical protein
MKLEQVARRSAALVLAGLTVEAVSLGWQHPTAFLVFFIVGGALLAAGMSTFVYSLIFRGG